MYSLPFMCIIVKSSLVRISPEYQFVLCVYWGWVGNGEQCAPDLKAVVDIGNVTSG